MKNWHYAVLFLVIGYVVAYFYAPSNITAKFGM